MLPAVTVPRQPARMPLLESPAMAPPPDGGARPPRLVGWRRHTLRPVPGPGATLMLVPSRGALPGGPSLLSIPVRASAPGGLRVLYRRTGPGDDLFLLHELEVRPGESRVQHLVGVPREATALLLQAAAAPGAPPEVGAVEVLEMELLPLTAVLSARWLSRQLREPARLPEKLGNLLRVLVREGVRAAVSGAVASQTARQAGGSWLAEPAPVGDVPAPPPWEGAREAPAATAKRAFDDERRRQLDAFLASGERLAVPAAPEPNISLVVVAYNRAELLLTCLRHVARNASAPAEIIVVDNASADETPSLVAATEGLIHVRNERNVGFVLGCNQGVERASGPYVLLLNSDAFVLPGAIEAAAETMESDPAIGVVGGPLLALDGTLQEAGNLVWRDGSAQGYGRGDDPGRPEYRFRRDVDYVSGAFLLTRRELWTKLGGFDEGYAPAYYEDVDYCFRVWDEGYRVVYEPLAAALHYEYGSSAGAAAAAEAMRRGRRVFVERHGGTLRSRPKRGATSLLTGRSRPRGGRVLVVDDRVPLAVMGSGSPRMAAILRGLVALDREVTFYPGLPFSGSWQEVYAEVPREVELMLGWDRRLLGRFLEERRGHYDHVMISRAHNMAILDQLLRRDPDLLADAVVIYDAEAIGAMRAVTEPAARGARLSEDEARALVRAEAAVASRADRVASVSAAEARAFRDAGVSDVHLLPHAVPIRPTRTPFAERRSFLFVGRLSEDLSPNADGLRWFVEKVWPGIREALEDPAELLVAGRTSPTLSGLAGDGVRLLGAVDDLTPLYERARVFVAPLRFSAGIPLKILEAASYGVPVVATDLLRDQLGWTAGEELLSAAVGDAAAFTERCLHLFGNPQLWEAVRERALSRVAATATMERFTEALERIVGPGPHDRG